MKKFSRFLSAALFSAVFFLSSCLDDSVAPEVAQLRQAQIQYLEALVRLQEAQALAQEIQNAYDSAINNNLVEQDEAFTAREVARWRALEQQELANLETQRLALEQAIDALEDWLEERDLADAQAWLLLYETTNNEIFTLTAQIIQTETDIAVALANENGMSGNTIAFAIQEKVADSTRSANLIVELQNALTVLQGVAADPTTDAAALATLEGDLNTLLQDSVALQVEKSLADEADSLANDTLQAVNDIITKYNTAEGELNTAITNIEGEQDKIATADSTITAQNDLIAELNAQLSVDSVDLNDETAQLAEEESLLADLKADSTTQQAVVDAAAQDEEDARNTADQLASDSVVTYAAWQAFIQTYNDYQANGLTLPANFTADSLAAYQAFQADSTAAADAAATADSLGVITQVEVDELDLIDNQIAAQQGNVDTQQGNVDAAQGLIDDGFAAIDAANTAIETENGKIDNANDALAQFESDSADAQAIIDACQTDYDNALATDLAAAEAAKAATEATLADVNTRIDVNADAIAVRRGLIDAIENNLDGIDSDIANAESALETEEGVLDGINIDLAELRAGDVEAQDLIQRLQDDLAAMQSELAQLQALATQYLALLTAALGS